MSDEGRRRERPLPPDGVYRTTRALPGKTHKVMGNMLVYFQGASQDKETPIVLLPEENVHNKWMFRRRGYLVRERAWVETLEPLLAEGFYLTSEAIGLGEGRTLGRHALVQLGYNRNGHAIVFPAHYVDNRIEFGARGKRFADNDVLRKLLPAGFERPLDGAHLAAEEEA